ncbi:MAG: purine-nucleoside phosphorylase [Ignavibacteria bacterium]|nr:purine-nucleoside phosphorylase [Ignavibacteria bacterium]MBT8382209.1 purine-nucleoside phosphorylase [Ignavibacteria bacterium]MBT8390918.1 purine-nucleoside phosphorylase [Ignavibacteria bacterium]NNJ53931.1 purine-nucleoside phosphorylase [Ignavibacteriaceae bacterium]NNL20584.1 purine-nucleoside phosphorylase [Ignavibacteriaceae bacterium]
MMDLNFKYEKLIKFLNSTAPFEPEIAIVLGSGLGEFSDSLETKKIFLTKDLPGYPVSSVEGHAGEVNFSVLDSKKLLIFRGRIHFYEGYLLSACILPSFIASKLGCKKLLLTNAAGGIKESLSPGDLMLSNSFNAISLKKELTQLVGLASVEIKNNFLNCPSKKINEIIKKAARQENIDLAEGVYWYTKGPSYETPAEIQFIKKFGGDAVGMSTVHEAVFGASLGLEVAAISCITNLAAGISEEKLSHDEVKKTAEKVMHKFSGLLKKVVLEL